jgi:hypothetical protein
MLNSFTLFLEFIFREDLIIFFVFSFGLTTPGGPGPSLFKGFTITLRHTTPYMTPLEE